MVTTVHLLAGTAIAVVLKQPALVIPVAFLFHYVLDAVPHYTPKPVINFKKEGLRGMSLADLGKKSLEPIAGILLVLLYGLTLGRPMFAIIVAGCIFAMLPDLLVFLEWKFNINRPWPIRQIEMKTHKHTGGMRGILPQIATSLYFGLVLLIAFPK